MSYLLDVSVLIALLDRAHIHHDLTQIWFTSLETVWATCPITENGVIRILSGSAYRNALQASEVIDALERLKRLGTHQFWPDDVSLLDNSLFRRSELQRSRQLTDTYLLGLAAAHGGKLATLDRRMSTAGVRGGTEKLVFISS